MYRYSKVKKKRKNPRPFWMCRPYLRSASSDGRCPKGAEDTVVCGSGVAKIFSTLAAAGRGTAAI
jgi:hypothetical protein